MASRDAAALNIWPELDGKRIASVAVPAFVIEATSSTGGRVTFTNTASTEVAWFTNSTEATVRFSLQDSSSAGAALKATLNDRVVIYGGTTS